MPGRSLCEPALVFYSYLKTSILHLYKHCYFIYWKQCWKCMSTSKRERQTLKVTFLRTCCSSTKWDVAEVIVLIWPVDWYSLLAAIVQSVALQAKNNKATESHRAKLQADWPWWFCQEGSWHRGKACRFLKPQKSREEAICMDVPANKYRCILIHRIHF